VTEVFVLASILHHVRAHAIHPMCMLLRAETGQLQL
jgi:hypothetical protein